ncbi:MAG: DsbE family thiol:disulfide interchange protein [Gammaproteobacteria bacterium]|jgi:cytochrome c biogenesis protein CcmG/thiol:disulfide interchange protein DsbE
MRYAIPIGVFIALIIVLAVGLKLDPRHVPSPLIGKPLPAFTLPELGSEAMLSAESLHGTPRLLNVWASWCVACRVEHPLLVELARSGRVPIVGLNYKDTRGDARGWLDRHGNPYERTVFDQAGRLGLDLGVYGVPETFVLDRHGIIRYKQVGPISQEILDNVILPLLDELGAES